MDIRVKIERVADGYRVSTSRDGNGWWGVGVDFPRWMFALNVANAIAGAFPGARVIDETGDV